MDENLYSFQGFLNDYGKKRFWSEIDRQIEDFEKQKVSLKLIRSLARSNNDDVLAPLALDTDDEDAVSRPTGIRGEHSSEPGEPWGRSQSSIDQASSSVEVTDNATGGGRRDDFADLAAPPIRYGHHNRRQGFQCFFRCQRHTPNFQHHHSSCNSSN